MRRMSTMIAGLLLAVMSLPAPCAAPTSIDARPFPRQYSASGTPFTVYQPQMESWEGNRLRGRFAVSVKTGVETGADGKTVDSLDYGVVWFSALTEVDKQAREVVLRNPSFERASFPTAISSQDRYLGLVRSLVREGATFTIDLDQLESALAITQAEKKPATLPVKNVPPEILIVFKPSQLILVDGKPALRPTPMEGVKRVINSRSLLLQDDGRYYTRLGGRWASAATLEGPWSRVDKVDKALQAAADQAVGAHLVDALDDPPESLQALLASGGFPDIVVRTGPAELIVVDGDPQFAPLPGTALSYIANTRADVIINGAKNNAWYVLVSGRWFTAATSRGPWQHVAPDKLPVDFAKIPPDSAKGSVLASIAGTPEAFESLIANSIPQTATVDRTKAKLEVQYDGEPKFEAIAGTRLQYAANTPVPVILVPGGAFYAVDKGVWFTGPAANGPWSVAESVPSEIYSIPTSSPLHYVTYVRIYGGEGDDVYVGYTPGYYGTVASSGVVVYGTGYYCDPWVYNYWYGCPATYGMGVYFGWSTYAGWSFGFGWGYYPWYPWWGPWWGYPGGWWGDAGAWNFYGRWGNAVVAGTGAAWANPYTGNIGRGYRGGYYNERTGGRGAGRGYVNTNAYTGTTSAGAQGIRYNPETGRVVGGTGAAAYNPYTGQSAAGGTRTVINTETGRTTEMAAGKVSGPEGAAGAGAINSDGQRVDISGAGGYRYNTDTGEFDRGGVAKINDDVYAGKDGNVYRYDDGEWQQVGRPEQHRGNPDGQTRNDLIRDRSAREGGYQRSSSGSVQRPAGGYSRPAGGYSRPAGGFSRPMGGGGRRR
ncbi:hypothetical protein [Pseudoxanthomonas kaohsiungensis]|uniref:Carbohydrate-binding family V/XII n=1 Tax=Pseudoxanthomonas kaohsiungensis TaxID=283923 RepID=A0ABW3LSF6_9GAMM|nr:hypothetical protein [Pseudoxanthomonas kaohsiungensis]